MKTRISVAVVAVLGLVLALAPAASASNHESKPAVVRGNEWLLRETLDSGPATIAFRYGRADDWPLTCDWNDDGTRTPGVVRAADNGRWQWFLKNSLEGGAADITFSYGRWDAFDVPICGDWDGDGTQTPGVVREPETTGTLRWLLRNDNASGAADLAFSYGRVTNADDFPIPVVGDWNDDSSDTPGLVWFTATTLRWQLRDVNASGAADFDFRYGRSELDFPIVGDWDGDGFDTIGVQRDRGVNRAAGWLLRDSLTSGAADLEFLYGRFEDWPLVWR